MKRILVVDDEPDVAELFEIFLNIMGYEVDVSLSYEESITAVEKNKYWVVFCDYLMPRATGDKLYYRIKEMDSGLAKRFIIVTGAIMNERLDEFIKKEGVRVINKPFKLEELRSIFMELERP